MRGFEIVGDKFRKNKGDVILPIRATSGSAGYDFVTPVDITIEPHGTSELIFTDIKASMKEDEVLTMHIRSSIGIKKGIILANITGIIDSDYYSNPDNDGNIGFRLRNLTNDKVFIKAGERVIQGVFLKYLTTNNDSANKIRNGGIGSTN